MTRWQAREAASIASEREESLLELDLRKQEEIDRRARELRAENARRAQAARRN